MDRLPHVERHPWPPYIPAHPRVLLLGTFPPKRERWSMEFFYPNRINDMWRVMGLIFKGRLDAYCDAHHHAFCLESIKALLDQQGIALWDTAMAVRRLRDNASDKYLEIVEPIDLASLLDAHPTITAVATAGEKATAVVAAQARCDVPRMGHSVHCRVGEHDVQLWRMPSTSRAYPLSVRHKALAYHRLLAAVGCAVLDIEQVD